MPSTFTTAARCALVTSLLLASTGCASLHTPGPAAALATLAAAAEPPLLASANALRLAVVQVQGAGYRAPRTAQHPLGPLTVVSADPFTWPQALASVPGLSAVEALDPALLPSTGDAGVALRQAAAKQQADHLLAYSLETTVQHAGRALPAAAPLPLKALHDGAGQWQSRATAVLLDVRTGALVGQAEGSAEQPLVAADVASGESFATRRQQVEAAALASLINPLKAVLAGRP